MHTLRSQLAEIFNGTLDDGPGLLRLNARSENIERELPRELAERLLRPMEGLRRLEASLIRVAGINPDRIGSLLEDDEYKRTELASILQQAAGDIPIESLATLRSVVVVDRQPIVRGYLDVVCSLPAITRLETTVLHFTLLALPNGDSLMRENHGWGYHYHYSDDGKRRADILLTFSRNSEAVKKPVTWEPHAIKKADFAARVPAWGLAKRESVHIACLHDLIKRKLTDYVLPGKDANYLLQ
jgi:hypothetical protein